MAIHYNAFISYRHHPDDIRVATDIQHSLERFHVPRALRKKTGRIERLFRDKEELPITSNLSDNIFQALENSDFLIVICSEHTKESLWVQREIETFLKTHDRYQVLTVLASGEPQDTIPEILQYETVTDPVTGAVTKVPVEPLSCDWRMSRRKAVREELPRLAATLLCCGYDELRQRQRQYKMRRTMAFFSAALAASLCLAGYFIYNSIQIQQKNIEIQANLDQSLINQSKHLASASTTQLEAGDRLTAIALAMAGLPGEDSPRPYVPAAELALANALGLYSPAEEIVAIGVYPTDAIVSDFILSKDGSTIFILDRLNHLTIWNVDTFQRKAAVDLSQYTVNSLQVTGDGNLLVNASEQLLCYDPAGQCLWLTDPCRDIAFLEDGTLLCLFYSPTDPCELRWLEPLTGVQSRQAIRLESFGELSPMRFFQDSYAANVPITVQYYSWDSQQVILVDTAGNVQTSLLATDGNILQVTSGDGVYYAMISDGSGAMNGIYGNMYTTSPTRADLYCYDTAGNVLWQNEIVTYVYSSQTTLARLSGTDLLLCQYGNTFQQMDAKTGQILAQCQTTGIPLTVNADTQRAVGVLDDGSYFVYLYADNECNAISYMPGSLLQAQINNGLFIRKLNDTQVTAYWGLSDNSWTVFDGDTAPGSIRAKAIRDDLLAITDYSKLYLYDMAQGKLLWANEIDYSANLLGFSTDGTKLYFRSYTDLLVIDTATGNAETIPMPSQVDGLNAFHTGSYLYSDDALLYIGDATDARVLFHWDMTSEQVLQVLLPATEEAVCHPIAVKGNQVWLWSESGNLYHVDTQQGTCELLAQELPSKPVITFHEDGQLLAAASGTQLYLLGTDGSFHSSFSMGEHSAVSLYFYDQMILALNDDGQISRYDREGQLLGRIALTLYDTFYSSLGYSVDPLTITWNRTDDGELVVNAIKMGNIIDCENWDCKATVSNFITYHNATDTLLCCTSSKLGAYPRSTTAQLLDRAVKALGSFTLSPEQLDSYGLNQ